MRVDWFMLYKASLFAHRTPAKIYPDSIAADMVTLGTPSTFVYAMHGTK